LSPTETHRLFELIGHLRDCGMAVVFISHFIEDVLAISDRVTILRNGRRLETTAAARLDKHYVIHTMLGYSLADAAGEDDSATVTLGPPPLDPPVLVADGLHLPDALRNVSLAVSPGECLGLYGLVGAGHEELLHVLAGSRRPMAGTVCVDDQPLRTGCHHAVRRGVALVTADRRQGLHMQSEVYKNVTLAHLRRVTGRWVTPRKEIAVTQPILERVHCDPPDAWMRTGNLSGGNQQKVVVAKWLLGPLKVLLLDEPTRGMDVGAKREVMRLVAELKQRGLAVVLASCEPEVLLEHADRILVMRQGRIAHQFVGTQVTKAKLMQHAYLEVTCP
jgi:ribose transport system ATP-binding protein